MKIGVPKEIKEQESRVAMVPSGVESFVAAGHEVFVEKSAGVLSGFPDRDYQAAGATILPSMAEVYARADMIIKVKEPLEPEYGLLREGQVIFSYLHLAPDVKQTQALIKSKCIAIAYETVSPDSGGLPLLAPMSEIAGRMSIQVGAYLLQKINGGSGVLLGGVPGVAPGKVVIIGGGKVGMSAAKIAVGMGATVTVLDISDKQLAYISDIMAGRVVTLMSNSFNIRNAVADADLLVGALLIPGARADKVVTEAMVKSMRPGSVIVDVAIDQGGSIETIDRLTDHGNPYYIKHDVVHYSVPNMPGAVPRTSTLALTNATTPYALRIAAKGAEAAMRDDSALRRGLNVYKGKVVYKAVADAQGLPYEPVSF